MNDEIILDDDNNEDEQDELQIDELLDSISDLFNTKRELDDLLETVVYELIDSFAQQENSYIEHIIEIEKENKELKQIINNQAKDLTDQISASNKESKKKGKL